MATGGEDVEGDWSWESKLLYQLCEDVGFSEDDWRRRIRQCDYQSTFETIYNLNNSFFTLFSGSSSEGLATNFLGSDLDIMLVLKGSIVTEHIDIDNNGNDSIYRPLSSDHPAFYRMNLLHPGDYKSPSIIRTPMLCEIDENGMLVLNAASVKARFGQDGSEVSSATQEHGPAQTSKLKDGITEVDTVPCLHCSQWPSVSKEWIYRKREWPPPEVIRKVTDLGCEFVPVGNPVSSRHDLEWRLSSSAAERTLVRLFNICQVQCYFMLKLLLVFLIKPQVPDSLCSYHMKNIILWEVEKTRPSEWRKENLAKCFMTCLGSLLRYLEDGYLPQFFIPQQNLFYPKVQGDVQETLISIVRELNDEGWVCLLKCEPFISRDCPHQVPRCPCHVQYWDRNREEESLSPIAMMTSVFPWSIACSLQEQTSERLSETVHGIQSLQHIPVDDLFNPSQDCFDLTNACLRGNIGYMCLSVTKWPNRNKNTKLHEVLQTGRQYLEDSCDTDMTAGRLKLATFYYQIGQVHKCVQLVIDVISCFTEKTLSGPYSALRFLLYTDINRYYQCMKMLFPMKDDIKEVLRHVSLPVFFSPWEIVNTPSAVQDLVHNRQYVGQIDRMLDEVIVIDSMVYAYYLLCISYRDLRRFREADRCLVRLDHVLRYYRRYGVVYPEVGQRLLYHCTRGRV